MPNILFKKSLFLIACLLISHRVICQSDSIHFSKSKVIWHHLPCICDDGYIDKLNLNVAIQNVNFFRLKSGLDTLYLSKSLSAISQRAAFICDKNGRQSHYIDENWKCFSEDRRIACNRSLIGSFENSTRKGKSKALVKGFFLEPGEENNRLLHRRWLMNPQVDSIGFGCTKNYETITPQIGRKVPFETPIKYSFPAAGSISEDLVCEKWSWSFYPVDFIIVDSIGVSVYCNNVKVPTKVICKDAFLGEFTLGWEMKGLIKGGKISDRYINQEIRVIVTGYYIDGQLQRDEYQVLINRSESE